MNLPKCPRCDFYLKPFKMNGLNYLSCNTCHGQLISLFNLDKYLKNSTVINLWEKSAAKDDNSQMQCPSCVKGMKTFNYSKKDETKSVEVDICRPCRTIWLDTNEKDQLEKINPSDVEVADKNAPIEGKNFQHTRAPGGLKTLITLMGLPVEAKLDSHKNPPILTWLLIIFSIVCSYMAFNNENLFNLLQFTTEKPAFEQFLSSMSVFFVHGGWLHLIGNMYFLFVFGDNVETDLGKFKYLILVSLGTLISTFAFTLTDSSGIPLVGASGGISALMGYYLLRFPKRKFIVSYFLNWFYISSLLFAVLYIGKDVLGMIFGGSNVAHISHLSGVIVGVLFHLIFNKKKELKKIKQS